MKSEADKIILESRNEVAKLQDVCEIAIASNNLNSEEKELTKRLSELLEAMYLAW